ncbi:hypothetical protein N644_0905 [Lactiplantibacillus paraplantarum]|uniref:hypothetical protein n=1 Tax=Lactiplantibacillus paraplantarum TaxID=60520 RepID=UPI0003AE71A9|nr:hypothetical protein [Lactiplantibacillus paraplantarum]ERL44999.1 hypothetical protein N644_0905 [Lactiplantibacillus paraplantarum]
MKREKLEKFVSQLSIKVDNISMVITDVDKFIDISNLESILSCYDEVDASNSETISDACLRAFVDPGLKERIYHIYVSYDINDNDKLSESMGIKVSFSYIVIRPTMGSVKFVDKNLKKYFVIGSLDELMDAKYKFEIDETNVPDLSGREIIFDNSEDSYVQDDIRLKIVLEIL